MNTRKVSLSDVVDFRSGGTPTKSIPEYFQGDVPWITGADIDDTGKITPRSFITQESLSRSAANMVPSGAILLVTRTSVGKTAIATQDVSFSQDITALLPDSSRLDSCYLQHFLRTSAKILIRQARGATIKGITRQAVRSLEIPLFPLKEQRRIAEILDQADELRAKRRRAIALLDDLAQSIFFDMFGDPNLNTKGWDIVPLSRLGALDRGVSKHRPRNDVQLLGGPYPLVQTGDVANSGGYVHKFKHTYSELGLRQSKLWPAGTLCITIAANIARTGILQFDACFPDSVVGFTSDPAVVEYVRVWFGFVRRRIEDLAPESAQKNINLKLLRGLPIPLPPTELIELFAQRISVIEETRRKAVVHFHTLDEFFESLQSRAFRGEL